MSLDRATDALETCRRHLDSKDSFSPQIEAILTAYASAVAYACFEQEVRSTISDRAHASRRDEREIRFGVYAAGRLVRSIKISELSGLAGNFDPDCKDAFSRILADEDRNAWDTIINNRHGFAHDNSESSGAISNLTFSELEEAYPKACRVLDAFRRALFE